MFARRGLIYARSPTEPRSGRSYQPRSARRFEANSIALRCAHYATDPVETAMVSGVTRPTELAALVISPVDRGDRLARADDVRAPGWVGVVSVRVDTQRGKQG